MIKFIKKWREKRRRKRILKIIKDAKQCFVEGRAGFMCHCFAAVYPGFWNSEENVTTNIQELIPEFNREFLNATTPESDDAWWYYSQDECRIAAFDKLIEIYERED